MYKNIFESHSHYDDEQFDPDREALLPRLHREGIAVIFHAGSTMSSSRWGVQMAEKYDFIYAGVGVHPHEASALKPCDLDELRQMVGQNPKVRAIGEIGLDYHYDLSPREVQRTAFCRQLELAAALELPVIIHSREATRDTMDILERYRPRGIVHCFSGSAETAQAMISMGLDLYFGFTGVITFSNAKKSVEAAQAIPLDRLLIETDCPYMAPAPFRGKRCDSSMLVPIAEKLASIKGIGPQGLIDITSRNACRIYNIDESVVFGR